jgi:hypothetical protein
MRSVGVLRGDVFRFRIKCPIQAAPERCLFAVSGLSKGKGSKPATATAKANMKANAARIIKVKVKPKFLALYQKLNKITVKAHVSVGNVSTDASKRVRLIHQK